MPITSEKVNIKLNSAWHYMLNTQIRTSFLFFLQWCHMNLSPATFIYSPNHNGTISQEVKFFPPSIEWSNGCSLPLSNTPSYKADQLFQI